jgi:transposase
LLFSDLPRGPSHPFYLRLNRILQKHEFDRFCEEVCAAEYDEVMGRPSIPPGAYFRMLMIGYFEGVVSERGIAWRVGGFQESGRVSGIPSLIPSSLITVT